MKKLLSVLLLMVSAQSWADVCDPSSVWWPPGAVPGPITFNNWLFHWTGSGEVPPGLVTSPRITLSCGVSTGKPPRTEGVSGLVSKATLDRFTVKVLEVTLDPSPAQAFSYEMAFWSLSFDDVHGNHGWLRLYLLPERDSILVEKRIQFASGKEEISRVRMAYDVDSNSQVCADIEVQRLTPNAPLSLNSGGDWKVSMRCNATGASDSVTTSFGSMAVQDVMVGQLSEATAIGEFSFSFQD
jgi:hypothetical protein